MKPGVYRHTITGLSPSTQYRVTVRAKHLRAGPPSGIPIEEAPGAYTDFRTLPKGLPDPPNEIMVRIMGICRKTSMMEQSMLLNPNFNITLTFPCPPISNNFLLEQK